MINERILRKKFVDIYQKKMRWVVGGLDEAFRITDLGDRGYSEGKN